MADSTTNIDTILPSQAGKEVTANAFFDAASQAALYGRRASTTSGTTWGYYGGVVTKADGTTVTIANGTLALSIGATNYIVASKASGVVSAAVTTTNWNDTANYWRLYSIVVATSTITSYVDYRQFGMMTGGAAAYTVAPVTKTASFTLIITENEVICAGAAALVVTLPAASTCVGRKVWFKNRTAFALTSNASNVKPIGSDTAGTAMLPALAGRWLEIVSDGTNWVVMSQGSDDTQFPAPVAKTTAFTVADGENAIVCNGTASITATLPAAASFVGRRITLKTIAAYTVISASSNVKPINSDTAGTAILRAIAGSWAVLVSDGTNWIITERGDDDVKFTVPVTKTVDFTVAYGENLLICDGTATMTVTLPSAAANAGRQLILKSTSNNPFGVNSASSNVVPLVGGAAGTAILGAASGKWSLLVSDGTNWIIMAGN